VIGFFAGRGDVIVAMLLSLLIGVWLGYYLNKGVTRFRSWRRGEK
jgi:hypothetical protein